MASEGLAFSRPTDPVTLARRLSFDLTGLPPSGRGRRGLCRQSERSSLQRAGRPVARFAPLWRADGGPLARPGALRRLVRLPQRRRAADLALSRLRDRRVQPATCRSTSSRASNWPATCCPSRHSEQRVATGYNRLNKTTEEGGAQAGEYLAKSAADRVRTTAGVWLAATLGCAECHDHKYDPYTARDFYSFAAFFADVEGARRLQGRQPRAGTRRANRRAADAVRETDRAAIADARKQTCRAWLRSEAEQREISQQAGKAEQRSELKSARRVVSPHDGHGLGRRRARCESCRAATGSTAPAKSVVSLPCPAFLATVSPADRRLTRLDLADWLVARDNPLTARVFVNRLWKLFFGAGLSHDSSTTSARRANRPRIPNCSTGWPSSSSIAAGT